MLQTCFLVAAFRCMSIGISHREKDWGDAEGKVDEEPAARHFWQGNPLFLQQCVCVCVCVCVLMCAARVSRKSLFLAALASGSKT